MFGIPGDTITAIGISVLYLKGMNPGPTIFIKNPENIYAVFLVFVLANLIMLPLGWLAIKAANNVLRVPRSILMPIILLFCVVGSYAVNNAVFGIVLILVFGLLAFVLEEHGFPIAPAILGVVLGKMLEENFITSMIKSNGDPSRSSRARSPAGWRSPRSSSCCGRSAHGWCARRADVGRGRRDVGNLRTYPPIGG